MNVNPVLSLYEFNLLIKDALGYSFPDAYLITAEIASLNVDKKGHCYLELVDKDEDGIRARTDARIWAGAFKSISREFEKAAGLPLARGLKILVTASLNFHERYGMSLIVEYIDPSYTIGEMARKRREIIERLTREGLLRLNKALAFPPVPKRIAVISSARAAGYEDFVKHLSGNSFGYVFSVRLFEAVMQGDGAAASMLGALAALNACASQAARSVPIVPIMPGTPGMPIIPGMPGAPDIIAGDIARRDIFAPDLVVIVRGGGAAADLDCFDNYEIGRAIALLPIPVISGIGHERDKTVVDEVAHTSVKTPTAAAVLIVERLKTFEDLVDALSHRLSGASRAASQRAQSRLTALAGYLKSGLKAALARDFYRIEGFEKSIGRAARVLEKHSGMLRVHTNTLTVGALNFMRALDAKLDARANVIKHLDPQNVLRRGYSITRLNGRTLRLARDASPGDRLETILSDGALESIVDKTNIDAVGSAALRIIGGPAAASSCGPAAASSCGAATAQNCRVAAAQNCGVAAAQNCGVAAALNSGASSSRVHIDKINVQGDSA
jgi:exodeoxyribonuclease VII large subunit